jgi:FAD synthase
LREERHFADLEALRRQMEIDAAEAQAALRA